MSNHHIYYSIERNPKHSAQRYKERKGVGYAKVDGEVKQQAQCRVSTDETPKGCAPTSQHQRSGEVVRLAKRQLK